MVLEDWVFFRVVLHALTASRVSVIRRCEQRRFTAPTYNPRHLHCTAPGGRIWWSANHNGPGAQARPYARSDALHVRASALIHIVCQRWCARELYPVGSCQHSWTRLYTTRDCLLRPLHRLRVRPPMCKYLCFTARSRAEQLFPWTELHSYTSCRAISLTSGCQSSSLTSLRNPASMIFQCHARTTFKELAIYRNLTGLKIYERCILEQELNNHIGLTKETHYLNILAF